MSELDDKLREILLGEPVEEIEPLDFRQLQIIRVQPKVDAIKAAFAEAGYVKLDKCQYRDEAGKKYTQYTLGHPQFSEFVRVPQFSYMTGQEFYDRFIEEINKEALSNTDERITDEPLRIIEAAKEAAGLET